MSAFPNLPRGVQAFLFTSAERRRRAEARLASVFEDAGLAEILLPVLDYAGPYEGVTAEGDDRQYRFMDRDGEMLALRADFTPMAARIVAPRFAARPEVLGVFYRGDVVRDERAGVGRPREFSQVGAERYGDGSFRADEEMLQLALRALEGIPTENLRLTLGYAGLLERLFAAVAPASTRRDAGAFRELLAAAREKRLSFVERRLVEEGAAAGTAAEVARSLLVGFDVTSAAFDAIVLKAPAADLRRAVEAARRARPGIAVVVDLAAAPAAPYYTGLTFSVDVDGGSASVASGGRYDRLLERFGVAAPALGFSIGLEAFAAALEAGPRTVRRPLRVAVGKGRLLAAALPLLRAAGARFPEPDGRRLLVSDESGRFELLLLKDDDVPTYVAHGGADLGIVGGDRVVESGEEVYTPLEFPFGECRLSLIGRAGEPFAPEGRPVAIGTKYRRVAARWFTERRVAHEIVPLSGSVELAAALRLTDVVVDLVETGGTIAANGLEEIEVLLRSRATLILGRSALATRREEVAAVVASLRAAARVAEVPA